MSRTTNCKNLDFYYEPYETTKKRIYCAIHGGNVDPARCRTCKDKDPRRPGEGADDAAD